MDYIGTDVARISYPKADIGSSPQNSVARNQSTQAIYEFHSQNTG